MRYIPKGAAAAAHSPRPLQSLGRRGEKAHAKTLSGKTRRLYPLPAQGLMRRPAERVPSCHSCKPLFPRHTENFKVWE
jgi:hypothetical protein